MEERQDVNNHATQGAHTVKSRRPRLLAATAGARARTDEVERGLVFAHRHLKHQRKLIAVLSRAGSGSSLVPLVELTDKRITGNIEKYVSTLGATSFQYCTSLLIPLFLFVDTRTASGNDVQLSCTNVGMCSCSLFVHNPLNPWGTGPLYGDDLGAMI